jgi:hypothetical protein
MLMGKLALSGCNPELVYTTAVGTGVGAHCTECLLNAASFLTLRALANTRLYAGKDQTSK